MALQLNQTNEFLNISGELTSENAITLKSHFEQFLNEIDTIVLNLENVKLMEPSSAFTIERLYLDFIKSNRTIQIIGKTNPNIAGVMTETKTSYILSDDRI